MVRPQYGNSVAEIPDSICELLDADTALESLDHLEDYKDVQNVVLILVDAFGYNQWKNFDSGIFKEAEENGSLHKITSVFPSATPVALTSINTGLQPIQHSLLGWEMYYEELDMIIQTLPFVDRDWNPVRGTVEDADPRMLFEGEPMYDRLENLDIKTFALLHEEISDGEFTQLSKGEKTEIRPYMNIADMSLELRKTLNQEEGKKYIYAYMDEIDKACHKYGPRTEKVEAQLEAISDNLERELKKVDEEVAEETLILFSADHGQIQSSEEVNLMKYEEVEKRLKKSREKPITPCGTARSVFLHVKKGEVEELKEFLEKEIDAEIYKTEETVKESLFGDRSPEDNFYSRAGELLIIPNGRKTYWYNTEDYEQIGYHGGLHEDEMYVPFCVTRLSDLV